MCMCRCLPYLRVWRCGANGWGGWSDRTGVCGGMGFASSRRTSPCVRLKVG